MNLKQSIQPRVSVVIPLYRSARFMKTIVANIEAMPKSGVEILISDRHCHDDTIDRLADLYAADSRVRCLKYRDSLDWVGHINTLLEEAQGEYWRFLPHDDLSPSGSLEALISALDTYPEAVLAYGPTQAIDGEGRRLPKRDRLQPHPKQAEQGWTLELILQMFWMGHFNGAFKGLIRRRLVMENQLLIRSTLDRIFPERCWLFGLCLLGRFHFVPEATYVKRFYEGSTHTQWKTSGCHFRSAALVMSSYLWDLVDSLSACWYGEKDLWLNAQRRARWKDDPNQGPRPTYQVAPGLQPRLLQSKFSTTLAGQNFITSHPDRIKALRTSHRAQIEALRKLPIPCRHQSII